MINEQAANAFKTAKTLTAFYTRLDLARDCITIALDNLPKDFDIHQIGRINDIRNILSREMAKIWDLRESEERRSCEQPPTPPDSDVTLIMDPPQTPYQFKSPSPAEDQNRTLSDSEFPELNSPTFPPDPTFIQVDNHGIPRL